MKELEETTDILVDIYTYLFTSVCTFEKFSGKGDIRQLAYDTVKKASVLESVLKTQDNNFGRIMARNYDFFNSAYKSTAIGVKKYDRLGAFIEENIEGNNDVYVLAVPSKRASVNAIKKATCLDYVCQISKTIYAVANNEEQAYFISGVLSRKFGFHVGMVKYEPTDFYENMVTLPAKLTAAMSHAKKEKIPLYFFESKTLTIKF